MPNVLQVPQQQAIQALIAKGWSVRRVARTLGINRRTVKCYAGAASKCTTEVIAGSRSLCGAFQEVIAPMIELGLSARRIYQDLVAGHGFGGPYPSVSRYVAGHGFGGPYPSVSRYVAKLKASEPERVWRMEYQPGEELQVDFELGAPLAEPGGETRRTWLFRAVLGHSRKGYREVVLRQDTKTFLRAVENAVRYSVTSANILEKDEHPCKKSLSSRLGQLISTLFQQRRLLANTTAFTLKTNS